MPMFFLGNIYFPKEKKALAQQSLLKKVYVIYRHFKEVAAPVQEGVYVVPDTKSRQNRRSKLLSSSHPQFLHSSEAPNVKDLDLFSLCNAPIWNTLTFDSLVNGFPVSTGRENTDTLPSIGSCITKEEHNYRCANLINRHLIQHSRSLLYIYMSTDTFNIPKESEDCWKIMIVVSLSLFFTQSKIYRKIHILPLHPAWHCQYAATMTMSFQEPSKPHVHRVL